MKNESKSRERKYIEIFRMQFYSVANVVNMLSEMPLKKKCIFGCERASK